VLDFLRFGLRYVYPQQPGAIVRGIETAPSAPPFRNKILSESGKDLRILKKAKWLIMIM